MKKRRLKKPIRMAITAILAVIVSFAIVIIAMIAFANNHHKYLQYLNEESEIIVRWQER